MAISSSGIGSGLDVNSIVEQLMTLEAQPALRLDAREVSYQAKLSAFGQLKSVLSPLQTALASLKSASSFETMKASVGDSTLASATASSSAAKGNYSLEVLQIAQSQRVITNETLAPSVAAGTLTFNFGAYTTDNTDPDNPVTSFTQTSSAIVTLDSGLTTLDDLQNAINDADIGVRAQIINNGTVDQLIIAGNTEGEAGGFQIVGSDGLSGFSYDASTGSPSTLSEIEKAQDASIRIDNITMTRSSNTITDAIDGVTLNLLAANADQKTTLKVTNDRSAVTSAISSLVKAYNEFNTTSRGLTSYNTETNTAAALTGDATARGMQTQIRNAFGRMFSEAGGVSTLSEVGVTFNRDGSLTFDSAALETALNDPDKKVSEFFTGVDGTSGFANSLDGILTGFLNSDGVIQSRTDGIKRSISSIDDDRDRLNLRLAMIETRYRAEYGALDSLIASMQQTGSYLTQQLANLPSLSNK